MIKINSEKFTIYEVEEMLKRFLIVLENSQNVILDFEGVKKIDMVAIQLLLSVQKSCEKNSKEFELINLSDELKKSIFLSGCAPLFGLNNG